MVLRRRDGITVEPVRTTGVGVDIHQTGANKQPTPIDHRCALRNSHILPKGFYDAIF